MVARTRFEARLDKARELQRAEAAGEVADSGAVRRALLARVASGELTLEQAQQQLRRLQRTARQAGLLTRAQARARG